MSMGLIDKETMIRTAQNIISNEAGYKAWAILDAIREAPEAVVRCKDCIKRETYDCPVYIGVDSDDWFCGDGERER